MTLFQSAMALKTAKVAKEMRDMMAASQAEAARQAKTVGISRRPQAPAPVLASEVMRTALERIAFNEIGAASIAQDALRRVAEINGTRVS